MPSQHFKFKQFTIQQDKTAMKVGTDGVLLGAWVDINSRTESALDIGAGTGLIALQLAQRSDIETIDALEIEPDAYGQAVDNFENSDWNDRLFCYHASLDDFRQEMNGETYDLIVSNPPFFNDNNKTPIKNRTMARHTHSLTFEDLLKNTTQLLSESGTCAFIIPYHEEANFLQLARKNKLSLTRLTRVKGNQNTQYKRSLIQLSFSKITPKINDLTLEIDRHVYTEDYKQLVKGFYLNL